LEAKLFSVIAL